MVKRIIAAALTTVICTGFLLPSLKAAPKLYSQDTVMKLDFELSEENKDDLAKFNETHEIKVEVDRIPEIASFEYGTLSKKNDWKLKIFLNNINYALSMYKEEALSCFPSRIYLVQNIVNLENGHDVTGIYSSNLDAMLLDVSTISMFAIHHELFHALQDKYGIEEAVIEKFNSLDSCELILTYACVSVKEEMAEAWAYSIVAYKNTEKIRMMKEELQPMFLKEGDIKASCG